jgi:predicted dehydrogenase
VTVEKLKVGWVGSGFVGQVAHLTNYAHIEEAEIVALAELRPRLGRNICQRYGIPNYFENHLKLLENTDAQAVVAIVRRQHTASVGLDILNEGRHLFTEKPMAPTLEQADRLVSTATAKGLCYSVGFMRRHDEGVQIAKRALDDLRKSGELGRIQHARFYCFSGKDYCNVPGYFGTDEPRPEHLVWPIAPEWIPKDLEDDYEHFTNIAIHDINLLRFFFDRSPSVCSAYYRHSAATVVLMDFDEFPCVLEFSDTDQNRWEEGVEIYFERGKLKVELPPAMLRNVPASVEIYKDRGEAPGELISPRPDWTWAFRREDEAFVKDVRSGGAPVASGEDSIEDMKLVEEIWRKILK